MFLADNILMDVINSKIQSFYKHTNTSSSNPHKVCADCEKHKTLNILPFPETIKDSYGNIDTNIHDDSSSSSDSSSDDENGNNPNSNNQRIIQPPSYNENIDTDSLRQRLTQPQSNGENVYNSMNQKIIQPLPSYSPSISSNESDTESLHRIQNPQHSPQIKDQRSNGYDLTQPNNINQERSNTNIADLTQAEMDINADSYNIRPKNEDLANGEEQFTAPVPEEVFRDVNVPNIRKFESSDKKRKKLKSKIRKKKDNLLQNLRDKKDFINKGQVGYNIRRQNDDETAGEEEFTSPVPEEDFMNVLAPIPSKNNSNNEYEDFDHQKKKEKKLKSKIRKKKDMLLQNLRDKKDFINKGQVGFNIRRENEDETAGEEEFKSPVSEEDFMDVTAPIPSKNNSNDEYEDFDHHIKKTKRVIPSRIRKQQKRIKKLKLLKLRNQRLRQLYHENKNQILQVESPQKDDSIDQKFDPKNQKSDIDEMQRDVTMSEHTNSDNNDDKNQTLTSSKRPTIRLRKFAYGTLPEQENISKPEIRVAKFAGQELIKDKNNIASQLQYLCELCKMQFPKYSSLKQHLQENHGKKQYKIVFPDKGKYLAHARKIVHKDDGSKFFYQNFNSNNDGTMDITSYWCSKCQKFLENFKIMQKHMLDHEEGETAAKRSITRERKPKNNKKILYESYN